jgi:putative peptidoglycan lipid II flippase
VPEERSLFSRVMRSTAVVSGIILLCKVMGFVEKVLLGAVYGSRAERYQMDIYLAAITVVVLFYDIMRYSLIPTLLPAISELREKEGEEASWKLASTFLNVMLPILGIAVAVILVWPKGVLSILFPKLPGGEADPAAKLALASSLLRIMFVGGLALIAGGIAYAILNSYKRFAAPAMGDLAFKVAGIVPLLAIIVLWKMETHREFILGSGIKVVAGGIMVGCLALLGVQLVALRRQLRYYRLSVDLTNPAAKKVLIAAAPLVAYAVFYLGRRVMDIYFAFQMPEGSYSGVDFSYRLIEFPFRFVIEPLSYVVFPFFAALALKGDRSELTDVLMVSLRGLVLLLLPMSVGLYLLREPVVRLLFEHGNFENVHLTVTPLAWYAVGVVAFGLDVILMRAYFSVRDVVTPVVMEALTFAANVILILALRNSMGNGAIALGFSLARTAKVVVLIALMRWRFGTLKVGENMAFLLKVVPAVAAMGVAVWFIRGFLGGHLDPEQKIHRAILVGAPAAAGAVVYAGAIAALKVKEITRLIEMAKSAKKQKAG